MKILLKERQGPKEHPLQYYDNVTNLIITLNFYASPLRH